MPQRLSETFKNFKHINLRTNKFFYIFLLFIFIASTGYFLYKNQVTNSQKSSVKEELEKTKSSLDELNNKYEELKNTDQVKRNDDLEAKISNIQKTYSKAVGVYEDLIEYSAENDIEEESLLLAESFALLSDEKWEEADNKLNELAVAIRPTPAPTQVATAVNPAPENVATNNTAPTGGYSQQYVQTSVGTFLVKMVAADYGSTRVIVDTASASDCADNCPVLPLSDFIARNGAYAGIHGAYYCPADYPSCAGKVNSFDLLIMNKDKYYFNSDNNVYSNNPGVVFGGSYIRWLTAVSQWGRDTGIDSMLSNFPLLIFNSSVNYSGGDNLKSSRGFVANRGNTVYIGVVSGASIADSAQVLSALGMENALNLDGGGTTALWHGGYKAGPGRGLTNAILFVQR